MSDQSIFINYVQHVLNERFELAKIIPRTRSFHQYTPLMDLSIGCMHVSYDSDFELKVDFNSTLTVIFKDIRISHFVLCTYDDIQWIGHTNGQVVMIFVGYL